MNKPITITITPGDARKAYSYAESLDCLLATAARRAFKITNRCDVWCGPDSIRIGDNEYAIDKRSERKLYRCYGRTEAQVERANRPKVRRSFKVKLTPIQP